MPKRDGKTYPMSTEWVVEVFDWEDDVPNQKGGTPGIDENFPNGGSLMSASVGILGSPGASKDHAYFNSDILTSLSSDSGLAALGIKIPKNPLMKSGSNADSALSWMNKNYKQKISYGVVSLSFSRSKSRPDQQCTITVAGPLPKHTKIGSWVIVSLIKAGGGLADAMPKFIGQIFNVSTEYNTLQNGAVVLRSTVSISSWSNLLMSRLAFDLRSGASLTDGIPATAMLSSLTGGSALGKQFGLEDLKEASKLSLNPYQAAKYFLSLIGLIGVSAFVNRTEKLYRSAACMPQMPPKFLERMGFFGDSKTAFANGFVKVIAGRLNNEDVCGFGSTWDGMFSEEFSFEEYADKYNDYATKQNLQPYMANMATVAQVRQASVWEMIMSNCDASVNEVFTDIFYEKDADGYITPYLALIVRGKPYKTKAAEHMCFGAKQPISPILPELMTGNDINVDNKKSGFGLGLDFAKSALSGLSSSLPSLPSMPGSNNAEDNEIYKTWDSMENIPRMNVDSSLIIGMTLNSTFLTSPTLFQLGYNGLPDGLASAPIGNYLSYYLKRHDAEMLRFGSISTKVSSQYCFLKNAAGTDMFTWFTALAGLNRVWEGYNYLTATGVMRIKDPGLPLTIGFNMRFEITGVVYIAQIESVDTSFSVDQRGMKSTVTSIQFSRLMQEEKPGSTKLLFCPVGTFADLWGDAKGR